MVRAARLHAGLRAASDGGVAFAFVEDPRSRSAGANVLLAGPDAVPICSARVKDDGRKIVSVALHAGTAGGQLYSLSVNADGAPTVLLRRRAFLWPSRAQTIQP